METFFSSTPYEYLDCSTTSDPKINSVANKYNKANMKSSDEHMAIRQLVLSLGDQKVEEQTPLTGFHAEQKDEQTTVQNNKVTDDEKGMLLLSLRPRL